MLRRLIAACLFAMPLSACIPIPQRLHFAPRIQGVVLDAGVPLANAEVSLSSHFVRRSVLIATTNAGGEFAVGPIHRWTWWLALEEPGYGYELNLRSNGQSYLGYAGGGIGVPRDLQLVCDLSHSNEVHCIERSETPTRR
jgi:hypothetical protein